VSRGCNQALGTDFLYTLKISSMKKINLSYILTRCFLTVWITLFVTPLVLAQDGGLDVDIDVDKEPEWYQQPWAWVIGAAVFILLLVAILRGGRKR
jgi:hypothetical protein